MLLCKGEGEGEGEIKVKVIVMMKESMKEFKIILIKSMI